MDKTCRTCIHAKTMAGIDGHFKCRHPATVQIEKIMWNAQGWPEDDGKLPVLTPVPCCDTHTFSHPKNCPAWAERASVKRPNETGHE